MMYITINVADNPSVDEMKRRARQESNGEYVTRICRGCGMLWFAQDGRVDQAVVVDWCSRCFEVDEYWMHDVVGEM